MSHCIGASHYPRPYPESPTVSSKMIKEEQPAGGSAQDAPSFSFASASAAPKRKLAETSSSRLEDDDDFVYPLHKRTNSATRLTASFCAASYDSERREGPEEDVDEETEALVKRFRTSIFRQEPVVSPSSTASRAQSPIHKDDDDGGVYAGFPSIGRATTICDDTDLSTDGSCDPPDMTSRPASPQEEELADQDELWSPSFFECSRHVAERDPLAAQERPEWLSSSSTSTSGASQPSPLWNVSATSWTGMFHQGRA